MNIDHIAIWTADIEQMKDFYVKYFGMQSNDMYINEKKAFRSYFLSWPGKRTRIELMHQLDKQVSMPNQMFGLAHLAISLGSEEKVVSLTEQLRQDGYAVLSEPRRTGDGYFESAISDPEGNYVELTV